MPLRSVKPRISLRNHPPHLGPGVSAGELEDAKVGVNAPQELEASTVEHPGVLLPVGEAKRNPSVKGQGGAFADVKGSIGMTRLHRTLLDRIQDLSPGNELPRLEDPDLEPPPP